MSPNAWARWATGRDDIIAEAPLDQEFQWVTRRTDALIPCNSESTGPFLMPTELLLRYNSNVGRRMRAYAALAEEKYDLPTYPLLLVMLPPGENTEISDRYEKEFLDKKAVQEYRVVKLWEMDRDISSESAKIESARPHHRERRERQSKRFLLRRRRDAEKS